jgi:hypothetical protein
MQLTCGLKILNFTTSFMVRCLHALEKRPMPNFKKPFNELPLNDYFEKLNERTRVNIIYICSIFVTSEHWETSRCIEINLVVNYWLLCYKLYG